MRGSSHHSQQNKASNGARAQAYHRRQAAALQHNNSTQVKSSMAQYPSCAAGRSPRRQESSVGSCSRHSQLQVHFLDLYTLGQLPQR